MSELGAFAKGYLRGPKRALCGLIAFVAIGLPNASWGHTVSRPGPETVAPIAESLFPAVVNISSTQLARGPEGIPLPKVPEGSQFDEFLKDLYRGPGNSPLDRKVSSLGSGFVIDGKAGLIVTNNHVIDGADEIWAKFPSGKKLKVVEIVGRDRKTDLALLKVKSRSELPSVEFGTSRNLRVGDWVMAIGNPFGLGGSLTLGIISATQRDINAGPYDEFLQTDASINKGNSGGPLFDMDGKVVGVNTAIISPSGGSIGIGFATPSDVVVDIIKQLRDFGAAQRGWLGVRIQTITEGIASSLGVEEGKGALVSGITPGGPGEKSGLKPGDVIVRFAGQSVTSMRSLPRLVARAKVGDQTQIEIVRRGEKKTLDILVGRMQEPEDLALLPKPEPAAKNSNETNFLGLGITSLTGEIRSQLGLDAQTKGVIVTRIDESSVAAEENISVGDVITEIQHEVVTDPQAAVSKVIALRKTGIKTVMVLIENPKGDTRFVALPIENGGE